MSFTLKRRAYARLGRAARTAYLIERGAGRKAELPEFGRGHGLQRQPRAGGQRAGVRIEQ